MLIYQTVFPWLHSLALPYLFVSSYMQVMRTTFVLLMRSKFLLLMLNTLTALLLRVTCNYSPAHLQSTATPYGSIKRLGEM